MQSVEISLLPADNIRLANLCGAMDENIAHIARALSVKIKRRGGRFHLSGDSADEAAAALRALYQRADKGIVSNDIRLHLAQSLQSLPTAEAAADEAAHEPAAPAVSPTSNTAGAMAMAGADGVRNAAQQKYWDKIRRHSVTLCLGPAGTGKTHIAVAAALQYLRPRAGEMPRRLVLSRPVVEAGGERLGFLPGDMEQKVNPYLRPLHDILYQLLRRQTAERHMANGEIEIIPLAFMRGLTLNNTVLILDEAQNTTPTQMKMLLTRLGENSKMIITGDTSQTDIPASVVSGLADAVSRLQGVADIAVHRFQPCDIVRHPLVCDILNAYENS